MSLKRKEIKRQTNRYGVRQTAVGRLHFGRASRVGFKRTEIERLIWGETTARRLNFTGERKTRTQYYRQRTRACSPTAPSMSASTVLFLTRF